MTFACNLVGRRCCTEMNMESCACLTKLKTLAGAIISAITFQSWG
jgi:hypothetical protein